MKRKGDLIFWDISELKTTKDALESLGFGAFVPRNDFKSAIIKALKIVTKGNEKLYRRFNDESDSVSFTAQKEFIKNTETSLKENNHEP
jgi:hypothetical protein